MQCSGSSLLHGFCLVGASRGYPLVAVQGLLIAVASLVGKHRFQGVQASVVEALGLSCPAACKILVLEPGIKPMFLSLEADS